MASIFHRTLHGNVERAALSLAMIEAVERQQSKLAAIELPAGTAADDAALARRAVANAFVGAFRWTMLIAAPLALASAVCACLLIASATQRVGATGLHKSALSPALREAMRSSQPRSNRSACICRGDNPVAYPKCSMSSSVRTLIFRAGCAPGGRTTNIPTSGGG
jgi:hypothetical protein